MTAVPHKEMELEDERTAQKQYRKVLQEKAKAPVAFSGPANLQWTGDGIPKFRKVADGDLVGRVALIRPDEDLLDGGTDYYIGDTFAKVNGIYVYGWSNPIAATFFRGSSEHYLCNDVAVVRALDVQNGQVEDFVDEIVRKDAPDRPFTKRGLTIPAPPAGPKLSPPRPAPTTSTTTPEPTISGRQNSAGAPVPKSENNDLTPLRAEHLLRERLRAPRTKSLAPVLSTLQPDQYDLVTVPAMDSMIIEGQPGTGKTIVAAHRAAYLVDEETPPENTLDGSVLVVGPTSGYSRHVRDVVRRLAGQTDRIRVMSLPELINHIIGVNQPPRSHYSRRWQDVDWRLAKFARSALSKLKAAKGVTPEPEAIYEYLRKNAGSVTRDEEWTRYLRDLPPYKEAVSNGIHGVLVAFIKWEVKRPPDLSRVEHVIVDEAQDVTPLEWLLLDEINEADAWTILGDLNQRRSDHTLPSWRQVLDVIAIDPDTPVRRMRRGYRSTKPILEFANRLLPRDQRKLFAVQEIGPVPNPRKVPPKDLADETALEIERLLGAYPTGTVAVIAVDPEPTTKALRAQSWMSSRHHLHVWERGGHEVAVLSINEARGLEFDAVLVIEPSQFPENVGRQGPLYTALTRANRELAVLHSKPLPEKLRR
ncbi:AAA family ATPase [uncultured Mycolicibacterium sp.]|uniref:AAA family ATPase n=1 Tax=uncultured Mycolicibacterium sp. TaxID=2320817 RepID=UPI0032B2502D